MRNIKKCFRGGLLVAAIALTVSSLVAGSAVELVAPTPAYAASKKSSEKSKKGKKSKKDLLKGVKVKKKVDKYTWSELAKISDAMTKSGSRKAALKIAKKYKLCDKKGKLDGSQIKRVALNDCETTVMIAGFYHDDLADGSGKAGITWQFGDGLYYGSPLYASNVTDFNILPTALKERLAKVTKDTVYLDGAKTAEATSQEVLLWAPSATECLGDASDMSGVNRDSEWMVKSLNAEGKQYDYYKDAGLSWSASTGHASNTTIECPYEIYFYKTDENLTDEEAFEQGKVGLDSIYNPYNMDETGFRSIYFDPSRPDDELCHLAGFGNVAYSKSMASAASNDSSWPSGNRETAVMPMFCLTSSSSDDSAAESNGVAIQDSVDNYSWKDLKVIADEIAAAKDEESATGIAKKYHLVGEDGYPSAASYKTVKLKSGVESKAYIAAFNHDDRSDGKGKAGITFIFGETPLLMSSMNQDGSNSGGWKDSDLRKELGKEVLADMPKDLKNSIVKVKKLTNNAGVTTDASSVTETNDSVWVPSVIELFGKDKLESRLGSINEDLSDWYPVYEAEGAQYDAWHGTGDTTAWTRTCDASESGHFLTYQGIEFDWASKASNACGVFPGFCL